MSPAPTLLLTLALTACAGAAVDAPRAHAAQDTRGTGEHAASRIGPPGARGLGLRRVDRARGAEPPLALY